MAEGCCLRLGEPTGHDILRADVPVSTSFVDAWLDLHLFRDDLGFWGQQLSGLVPGRTARIGGDRGLNMETAPGAYEWNPNRKR
ncbi:DUF5959 family protein [Streptomyces sp. NBC_00727]|uniref:DUF5959 family protein n=1 Tax=Streptomyces sp. NBC_00727 TaxID=2903675 RepID=UPI00386670EE